MVKTGYDWLDKALEGDGKIQTPVGVATVRSIEWSGVESTADKVYVDFAASERTTLHTEYDLAHLDRWRRLHHLRVGERVYYGYDIGKIVRIDYGRDGLPETLWLDELSCTPRILVPASDVRLQPVEGIPQHGVYQIQCKADFRAAGGIVAERVAKEVLKNRWRLFCPDVGFYSGGFVGKGDFLHSGAVAGCVSGGPAVGESMPKPLQQRVLDDYDTRVSKISGYVTRARRTEMLRRSLKKYYGDPENSFVREHYERNPDTGEVTFVRKGDAECPQWALKEERANRGVVLHGPKFTLEEARRICGQFGWSVAPKQRLSEVQEKFETIFASKVYRGDEKRLFNKRVQQALYETIEEMMR